MSACDDIQGCSSCGHFIDDPRELERNFPGIQALSSAFGSTRGRAGICRLTEVFQDPQACCRDFVRRGDVEGLRGERFVAVTSREASAGR